MGEIINLNDYKRKMGIALPRSPYYTLNATEEQIRASYKRAAEEMSKPISYNCYAYAALVGYEDKKTGRVKLLKEMRLYSSRELFESQAGIKGHLCVALVRKQP